MRSLISLATAAALAGGALTIAPAAEARPGFKDGQYASYYGGRRGYRRGGNAAAAAAAVGIAGAVIGGAIAASQRPRYHEEPYGYYGRGPGYGYGPYGYDD